MGRGARRICTDQGWATNHRRGADTFLSRATRFLQGTARLALRWTIPANGLRQDSKIRASRDVSPAASDTALASALSAVPIRWPKSKGPHWGRGRRRYHRLRRSAVGQKLTPSACWTLVGSSPGRKHCAVLSDGRLAAIRLDHSITSSAPCCGSQVRLARPSSHPDARVARCASSFTWAGDRKWRSGFGLAHMSARC